MVAENLELEWLEHAVERCTNHKHTKADQVRINRILTSRNISSGPTTTEDFANNEFVYDIALDRRNHKTVNSLITLLQSWERAP